MKEDNKFTNIQEEKIYECSQMDGEEKIYEIISSFFAELIQRRRNDPFEGGLQACAVIFPNQCAMKICENDGNEPHANAFINLVKYLNKDDKYISLNGARYFSLSRMERKKLIESGIGIRILDGKDELMLAINSNVGLLSQNQINILNKFLLLCKRLKDKKIYNTIIIGIHIDDCEIDFEDLSNEHYENIINSINNSQSKTSNI